MTFGSLWKHTEGRKSPRITSHAYFLNKILENGKWKIQREGGRKGEREIKTEDKNKRLYEFVKGSCQLFWLFAFGLRSHLLEHTNWKFSVISDEKKKILPLIEQQCT